ncbi:MAG: metallophosphoesterase family protein [Elusimicrobia bacterium]|nr:metallophosphoesterase family protein [Elusimicrobiota bacterium]
MIYGVFSDVHSNLEALSAVLDALTARGAGAWICGGDLVGYGPDPGACLARVRALPNLSAVAGNHDLAAIGRMGLEWFNPYAREAVLWTRERLADEDWSFLEGLPGRVDAADFTLVHGTPRNPPEEYLLSPAQFRENAPLVGAWPLIVGHSHIPLLFRFRAAAPEKVEARVLDEGEELLPRAADGGPAPVALNPGSVGQPRDQDPRAACGVYDSDRGTFQVLRVPYDIAAVQAKIRAAGLPERLAVRLQHGQ